LQQLLRPRARRERRLRPRCGRDPLWRLGACDQRLTRRALEGSGPARARSCPRPRPR
jgi:hypothetical protein